MTLDSNDFVAKVHPSTREMLPDDPLNLHAVQVTGDPNLMLRLLVEEYVRFGASLEEILQLGRSPFYQAFHGLYTLLGEERFRAAVAEVVQRYRRVRVRTIEAPPLQELQLVQIDLPT